MTEKTNEEVVKNSQDVVKWLKSYGLKAEMLSYHGEDTAYIEYESDSNNQPIRFWAGQSDVEVYGDKKRRQAVLVLVEKARKVVKTYNVDLSPSRVANEYDKTALYRSHFRVNFGNAEVEYSFELLETNPSILYPTGGQQHKVKATASVKGSRQSFLLGYDEHEQFVCALPKNVKTVENAHKVLRPKGVPANALRQGEWFFVPASKEELKELDKLSPEDMMWGYLEEGSNPTHYGLQRYYYPRNNTHQLKGYYVIGPVVESRGRHKMVVLPAWHKAIHNMEVESDNMSGSWD